MKVNAWTTLMKKLLVALNIHSTNICCIPLFSEYCGMDEDDYDTDLALREFIIQWKK